MKKCILICRLIEPHPNTYTYSKRLAEKLVSDEHKNMPVAIARPSIGKLSELICAKFNEFPILSMAFCYFGPDENLYRFWP